MHTQAHTYEHILLGGRNTYTKKKENKKKKKNESSIALSVCEFLRTLCVCR